MGRFSNNIQERANEALLNEVKANGQLDSVKEIKTLLNGVSDNTTINAVIDARVTAGINAAVGTGGAIKTCAESAAQAAITAAVGEDGAVTTCAEGVVTAGIAEGGSIYTWAEDRYEPKTAVGG